MSTPVVGSQQITGLNTFKELTVPAGAKTAVIFCESQAVRYWLDGTTPTAAIGMRIAAGATVEIPCGLKSFKAIEEAASAKLNVSYFA